MHLRHRHSHRNTLPLPHTHTRSHLHLRGCIKHEANEKRKCQPGGERFSRSLWTTPEVSAENEGKPNPPQRTTICGCILSPSAFITHAKNAPRSVFWTPRELAGWGWTIGGGISGDCLKFMTCLVHMPHNVAYIWAVGGMAAGILQLPLFAVFAAVITAPVAGVVGIVSK